MSVSRPLEIELLSGVLRYFSEVISTYEKTEGRETAGEFRFQVLEACSAEIGGFDFCEYQLRFGILPLVPGFSLQLIARNLVGLIAATPIPKSLALSALAREVLDDIERRTTGAYHTDFRLARKLASVAAPRLTYRSKVIDPACGAGILLVALTMEVCGADADKLDYWLGEGLCASDLSRSSLRGTLLSLASLTSNLDTLVRMRARWYCGDSLLAEHGVWTAMAPDGFDAVIANPPWEKLKVTKHETLRANGGNSHYGHKVELDDDTLADLSIRREIVFNYSKEIQARFADHCGGGETDLYVIFTALLMRLCKMRGIIAALVPAGLIRSQGTSLIRHRLLSTSSDIQVSIIDNRARFFAIDSRFKFLLLSAVPGDHVAHDGAVTLLHERGLPLDIESYGNVKISQSELYDIRPDLSLPEVRNRNEWDIFKRMTQRGCEWTDPVWGWEPDFCREVDMTKERPKFVSVPDANALPVVEGRMVQQHRFGAKAYVEGTGRRALWRNLPIGESAVSPQFWICRDDIPAANRSRVARLRVGFCDIAGQTNERSLMAALIPPGVVCGNKVPTLLFVQDSSEERLFVWTAIANSISFDWMLRRVLTTTVNYFLLQSVRLPKIRPGMAEWEAVAAAARELHGLSTAGATTEIQERIATLRAAVDAEIAFTYGLTLEDMELILTDFPILDRGQAPISNEKKSTVTRDMILNAMAEKLGLNTDVWQERIRAAQAGGALGYVPAQIGRNANET